MKEVQQQELRVLMVRNLTYKEKDRSPSVARACYSICD